MESFCDEPLETLGSTSTPDGRDLVLYRRGDHFQIRIDGLELMGSVAFAGERALATETCRRIRAAAPRVLLGGLGMGYTLRAALDALGSGARVVVAEVFQAVVDWNRGPLAHLSDHGLADPRVEVRVEDVGRVVERSPGAWDGILLDVDNGPEGLVLTENDRLYRGEGLERCVGALAPGGILAVWSAGSAPAFEERLRKLDLAVEHLRIRAHPEKALEHSLYLGRLERRRFGARVPRDS